MDLRYQKGNNRPEGRYQKGNKIPKTVAKDLFFSFLRSVMGTLFNCCFKFSGSTQTLSGMKIGQDYSPSRILPHTHTVTGYWLLTTDYWLLTS
jgi:hypothetical protein